MVVYVTRYALTSGIQEYEAIEIDAGIATVASTGSTNGRLHFHVNDWKMTRAAAVAQANEMRRKKIASLKRKIELLGQMTFE